MRKKWSAEDDAELLRLILQMYAPKIDYGEVAARLNNGATIDAVRHRVRKYRSTSSNVAAGKSKKGVEKERESDEEPDDGYQKVKKAKVEDLWSQRVYKHDV